MVLNCLFHNLFPVFRSGRVGQILLLEFIKDGLADLGDEFHFGCLGTPDVSPAPKAFSCV